MNNLNTVIALASAAYSYKAALDRRYDKLMVSLPILGGAVTQLVKKSR